MEPENYRVRKTATDANDYVPKYEFPSELPKRPGTNTNGKAIQIRVNQFKVTQWPPNDIWQYDVSPFSFTTWTVITVEFTLKSALTRC